MVIFYPILSLYILWIFYLAVMSLYRANKEKKLPKVALILGYPILIIGALLDFLTNIFIISFVLFEIPKELLVTQRLSRHIKVGSGYRFIVSNWICKNLLNQFDSNPQGHCR